MLSTGIALAIIGVLIGIASFVFAARNMGQMANSFASSGFDRQFNKGFRRHFKTMIPMALGGLLTFVGIILIVVHFLQKVTG